MNSKRLKRMKNSRSKCGLALMCAVLAVVCGCTSQTVQTEDTPSQQTAQEDDDGVEFVVKGTTTPHQENNNGSEQSSGQKNISAEDTDVPQDGTASFNMSVAGDYIIYDSMYNYAYGLNGSDTYNFKPMVRNLRQFTEKCDINYYNQETVLAGDELPVSSYPMFVNPTEAGDAMVNIGYNLVSTATNHSLDGGEDGVLAQYDYWKKQKDVLMTGTYNSQQSRDEVRIKECNGIRYTMLSYTYATNGIPLPEGKDYLVNVWPTDFDINDPKSDQEYINYKKQVKKDIEAVRDKVDFLIVTMHSGVEYAVDESEYQRDTAKFLAENGADLVIGTHPHVIQPAEYIGDTLVYYSLGNLLCAQMQDEYYNKVTSILATFTVNKETTNGETKITFTNLQHELLYSYYNQGTWGEYCVIPFSNKEIKEFMPEYKEVYETYKQQFTKRDPSLYVVPCATGN